MKNLATLFKSFVLILVVLLLTAVIYGCGGGGGGGDPDGLTYTGLTTPALIDENNAGTLIEGSFAGPDVINEFMLGAVLINEAETNRFRLLLFAQQVMDEVFSIDLEPKSPGVYVGAINNESETVFGFCGGNRRLNRSTDDETGEVSGTLRYNDFCVGDVTINGLVTFTGIIDLISSEPVDMFMNLDNLTYSDNEETFTISGNSDLLYKYTPSFSLTHTINYLIKDQSTSKTYKFQNCQMVITEGNDGNEDFDDIIITERYFDPDYGYVNITTSTSLKFYSTDEAIFDGVVILEGANGTAGGSTKARFTALNETSYMVEADTTGDGVYDYNSGTINW